MSYECSLQGIVVGNEQKERTFQRLVGLCGNHSVVDLFEHELVFIPSHQTPIGPARNDDVVLRLQSKITNEKEISMKYRQWFLCMQGNSEPQRTRTVTVRPMSRVQLSGDIFRFMKSLGYSFSFDVVRKGYTFAYDKVLKITMTQLYKCKKLKVESAQPVFSDEEMWVIEVTSTAVPQEQVNQMAEHLNKLKALLVGVVNLEYVDTRALQNRIPYSN